MPEPEPLQPHEGPLWFWVVVWPVVAALPDVACEPTLLVCDTEPSSPGLSTRIETLVFDGSTCVAVEAAPELWPVPAD